MSYLWIDEDWDLEYDDCYFGESEDWDSPKKDDGMNTYIILDLLDGMVYIQMVTDRMKSLKIDLFNL